MLSALLIYVIFIKLIPRNFHHIPSHVACKELNILLRYKENNTKNKDTIKPLLPLQFCFDESLTMIGLFNLLDPYWLNNIQLNQ